MKKICPLIKKECVEHQCQWYTHLLGAHPQTNKEVDEWGCAVTWLPVLLIESSNQTRKVQASLDRNNNTFVDALPDHVRERILLNSHAKALNVSK